MVQGGIEAGVVLFVAVAPLDFREGAHTGKEHVLKVILGRDVLCPEIGLHAKDVVFGTGCNAVEGLVGINILQREVSTNAEGLLVAFNALVVVEVAVSVGSHDGVKAH